MKFLREVHTIVFTVYTEIGAAGACVCVCTQGGLDSAG